MAKLKFIDLFAGLGGFHLALQELGHECVYACELNDELRSIYKQNFPKTQMIGEDITKIDIAKIPSFDILCAGFPCQPFSKAGKQTGRNHEYGKLFDRIIEILKTHKPKYFILENVAHLIKHKTKKNGGEVLEDTWTFMQDEFAKIGYGKDNVNYKLYSPHQFGVPQHRNRVFIIGAKNGLNHFDWESIESQKGHTTNFKDITDKEVENPKKLNQEQINCIEVWQEFLDAIPEDEPLGFPIWANEFGATYPYESNIPYLCKQLDKYKGNFGQSLKGEKYDSKKLPSYSRLKTELFPNWKQNYIKQNRELYKKYKDKLDPIVKKIEALPIPSWQKFEWNIGMVKREERSIKDYILQFRASGLRVKKTDFAPSLVCTSTQVPIVGWEYRYITRSEALKLQSMEKLQYLPKEDNAFFKAIGNAINVTVTKIITEKLVKHQVKSSKKLNKKENTYSNSIAC